MTRSCSFTRGRQRGVAAVEFALVSIFFFTLVLGIIELGRLMYVWNTVQEVTRHAAREAVVRSFAAPEQDAIQREAIFNGGTKNGTVYLPASPEISNLSIKLTYLNGNLAPVQPFPTDAKDNLSACADAGRSTSCIRYVQAEVCDVVNDQGQCDGAISYTPLIGFLLSMSKIDFSIPIPVSPVVMPAESLGLVIAN